MGKSTLIVGSTLAGLAVAIGAFGAHGLASILSANERVDTFETAVLYHMFHALALILVGIIQKEKGHKSIRIVAYLFTAGVAIFSGSLYALSVTNITILGAITPIGGICFITGWIWLVVYFFRNY